MKVTPFISVGRWVTGCTLTTDHKTRCSAHCLEKSRWVQVKCWIKVTQVRDYINVMINIMGKLHHFKIQLSNPKKSISFDRAVEFFILNLLFINKSPSHRLWKWITTPPPYFNTLKKNSFMDSHNYSRSWLLYLINNQVQLLIAIFCADKYFWKSEFGLRVFKIGRSCKKPGENKRRAWIFQKVKTASLPERLFTKQN